MARDAVTITPAVSGAGTTNPAGTTISVANGAIINDGGDTNRLLVRVTNTDGSPRAVTFKAGTTEPPAVRKGLGDLVVSVPATTGDLLFVLESARFVQPDGSILVDFAASSRGIISAVRLPKGA